MTGPWDAVWKRLTIKRPIDRLPAGPKLERTLGIGDLLGLGLGAIIGTGIFVLLGLVTATHAGPGVTLSFLLAGGTVMLVALLYAELASMMPESGSAYVYVYTAFGELAGWLVGWTMLLTVAAAPAAAAIGWVGYSSGLLHLLHVSPPGLGMPGVNLPAALLALAATAMIARGVRATARVNTALVISKIAALGIFLSLAAPHAAPANWQPYMPFGWQGILAGGAILLFAYFGFDVLATTAEESKTPQRSVPLALIGSLLLSGLLYVAVAAAFTGVIPQALYPELASQANPLAFALKRIGKGEGAIAVSLGAVAGITSLLLAITLAHSRVLLAMARDGLLPQAFSRLSPDGSPRTATLVSGGTVVLLAGGIPLGTLAELATLGALLTFSLVALGAWRLRRDYPEWPRPFKAPFLPGLAIGTLVTCVVMAVSLPRQGWFLLLGWLGLGGVVYAGYGIRHSLLGKPPGPP